MKTRWREQRIIKEDEILSSIKISSPVVSKHSVINNIADMIKKSRALRPSYLNAMRSAYKINKTNLSIPYSNLPAEFDGFRILHLSDLHLDSLPNIYLEIIEKTQSETYDICIITGDYTEGVIGSHHQIMNDFKNIIKKISVKYGIFATLGNHDSLNICEDLEKIGVRVLNNEEIRIESGTSHINILGLDDVHQFYSPLIHEAISKSSINDFNILAVHSPEAYVHTENKYDLYLTGHTHGGQVNFPLSMKIYRPLNKLCEDDMMHGIWKRGRTIGHTSSGIGTSVLPIRYNSYGEVSTITLFKK